MDTGAAKREPGASHTDSNETEDAGMCKPGYEPVEEAFVANFKDRGEVGAAFCLYHRGEKVVDLWGGIADEASGRAWYEDTLQLVFSATKGAMALCALRLVEQGRLDLDAPMSDYWPEFGTAGKEKITARMVLSHRAGLPVIDQSVSADDVYAGQPIVRALEQQTPIWTPDQKHGYHGLTIGWLIGELVFRITGRSLGQFFRDEIAEPLHLGFWIGLPASQEHRVSSLIEMKAEEAGNAMPPDSLAARMLMGDALSGTGAGYPWNSRALHASEMPAVNGICTARSLAKMYAATIGEIDGVRLINLQTLDAACTEHSNGADATVDGLTTRFGLGFHLTTPEVPLLGPHSFGHPGAGGSLGFADPEHDIAFGYTMNRLGSSPYLDERATALVDAVRTVVADTP